MFEFQIKSLNEILERILEENTLGRKLKSLFQYEKYCIRKSRVQNLMKEDQDEKSFFYYHDFISLIVGLKLPVELKLDSYISIHHFLYNNFRENFSVLKYFIESFCKANFNLEKVKDPEFIQKYRNLIRTLISDLFRISDEGKEQYFVPLITLLFDAYYKLVKTHVAEGDEYIGLFDEIYNNIPPTTQNLKKWFLHFDYYLTVKDDLDATLIVIESFLNKYPKDWRKEMYRDRYPNPVTFLEIVYERFSEVKKKICFITFLLDYYKKRTTNYIPSFFLKKKKLNDPGILEIIEKNLNYRDFDPNYLKEVHGILINHKPSRLSFHYYCKTIAALQKQYFTIASVRPTDFKKLNIDQLFKLFVIIYRENPEIREYPSNLFQFFIGKKKNVTNQAILQNYLEILNISENYREFWDICRYFYDFNEKSIKKNKNYKERTWFEFRKNFESLLEKPGFCNFKQLYNIFKEGTYNYYLKENSLDEFIKKEFSLDSSYLNLFLYTFFSYKARENKNWDLTLKIINEMQSFRQNQNITLNSLDLFLERDPFRKEKKEIEFNHLILLIRSGKNTDLKYFLEQSVNKELENYHKDLSKIACIYFLLGNFMESRNYFQKNIDSLKKPHIFSNDKILEKIEEDNINLSKFFIELTDFELKLTSLGSLMELKREITSIIEKFDDCVKKQNFSHPHFWYFPLFIVFLHYKNLDNYCFIVEKLEDDITAKSVDLYDVNRLYTTDFCQEWYNLKNLWKILIETGMTEENQLYLSKNQYEIFIRNPLFNGISEVFKKSFPAGTILFKIFNYKPDQSPTKKDFLVEITEHLKELGIVEDEPEDVQDRTWKVLLNHIARLLLQTFNKQNSFHSKALKWKVEKEMQEWFKDKCTDIEEHDFITCHSEPEAGGGKCEHFINKIPVEDKIVVISDTENIGEFLEEQYEIHYPQVRRYAIGKQSKYSILLITDKREEIINDKIRAASPNNCLLFKYDEEDKLWCAVFAFQVLQKSPAHLRS